MKYRLVIFDLDGTILDTLGDLADSVNYALAKEGFPLRTVAQVREFVGNGIRKLIERALPPSADAESVDRVFATFKAYYGEHCAVKTAPYEGIIPMLGELKMAGAKLAVLSNKADFAVQTLCEHYFGGCFDRTFGEREGIRRKPAPDAVNELIARMDVSHEATLYVGDSEVDLETARNAGVDCIAVDWGFRDRALLLEHGAERVVSSTQALVDAILEA